MFNRFVVMKTTFFTIFLITTVVQVYGQKPSNEMNIPINQKAPVVERQELFINASPEQVWEVLASINEWPLWQSEVTEAKLEGQLSEGSIFKWKAGGISFKSKLHTVKPFQKLGWTGTTLGASAIHNWSIEPQENGSLVRVEESLQGFFPVLFKKKFKKDLKTGMERNLQELKTASEKIATGSQIDISSY